MATPTIASTPLPDLRTANSPFAVAVDGRVVGFMPRRVIGGTEWTLRSGRDYLGTVTVEGFLTFYTVGYGIPHQIGTASAAVRVVLANNGMVT
ncbi:hypothetical protein [Streptomyces sp. DW26H14]|uniref:hypothetical protein n=1 Tax=Streptomyces sp. DW26H14 TaxID=3435395 RepID=UPI00403DD0C2